MKIISWNVNGIYSCIRNGMVDFILEEDADVYCFQEVKSSNSKFIVPLSLFTKYRCYKLFAKKSGYSGLIVFSKQKAINVIEGINDDKIDSEARVLTIEFESFYLLNLYFPHSGRKLERLDFKVYFNEKLNKFCNKLRSEKPVILAGDFNVAHKDIDLKNNKQNKENAGFTNEEREWFSNFIEQGFVDTFREFEKGGDYYTWWSSIANCRERNIGWRLDYFLITENLKEYLKDAYILKNVLGSDHCPIGINIDLDM